MVPLFLSVINFFGAEKDGFEDRLCVLQSFIRVFIQRLSDVQSAKQAVGFQYLNIVVSSSLSAIKIFYSQPIKRELNGKHPFMWSGKTGYCN